MVPAGSPHLCLVQAVFDLDGFKEFRPAVLCTVTTGGAM